MTRRAIGLATHPKQRLNSLVDAPSLALLALLPAGSWWFAAHTPNGVWHALPEQPVGVGVVELRKVDLRARRKPTCGAALLAHLIAQ